jgi:hypothetical protein
MASKDRSLPYGQKNRHPIRHTDVASTDTMQPCGPKISLHSIVLIFIASVPTKSYLYKKDNPVNRYTLPKLRHARMIRPDVGPYIGCTAATRHGHRG